MKRLEVKTELTKAPRTHQVKETFEAGSEMRGERRRLCFGVSPHNI